MCLEGLLLNRKNMCPIGSIVFTLKVAPKRIDNNLKGHYIEKLSKLNCANMSVFLNPQILMLLILNGLQ